MFKYLMKYDLKKMLKILVYFYFCSLLSAVITRLINIGRDIQFISIIGMVFSGITISLLFNILINTFIHIISNFVTTLYKDQGYLLHTLPVKKDEILLSKYISSLFVIFLSVVISFICLIIIYYTKDFMLVLKNDINQIVINFDISLNLFIFLIVLEIFSQICAMMSIAFTAIVKGFSYNYKKVFKSFLWFMIYYFICMAISVLVIILICLIIGRLPELFASQMSQTVLLVLFFTGMILYFLYALIFYFICRKMFNKGVNLD